MYHSVCTDEYDTTGECKGECIIIVVYVTHVVHSACRL